MGFITNVLLVIFFFFYVNRIGMLHHPEAAGEVSW